MERAFFEMDIETKPLVGQEELSRGKGRALTGEPYEDLLDREGFVDRFLAKTTRA